MAGKPYYGMPWNLTEMHGWGLVGVHTALYLLDQGRIPLPMEKPLYSTMRPHVRERLASLQEPYERFARMRAQHPEQVLSFNDIDIMHPLGNGLASNAPLLRGLRNIGVVAFEHTLMDEKAKANGAQFDFIVAHSRFNCDLLRQAGFADVRMAWQGVDPDELVLPPRQKLFGDRFVVFSGGKLEYRKGQDLVLEAFRRFHPRHPDSVLITAWQNMWPEHSLSMAASPYAKVAPTIQDGRVQITQWALANGLPEAGFVDLGFLNRAQMAAALAETDAAVFPNRCEGATNLVAMEAMGAAIPCIIADNTGQSDLLLDKDVAFALTRQNALPNPSGQHTGWSESDPDEIVAHLERIYSDRAEARRRAAKGRDFILGERTWRKFAETFVAECDR